MKFKDWFDRKLVVGKMPDDDFNYDKYDYMINVSCEYVPYRPNLAFWFPMNECKRDIGLNSLYGALCILNRAYESDKSVYLHCHAGINRSQSVRAAFYYMKTGSHFDFEYGSFKNTLIKNCAYGYLPPLNEAEDFLKMLNEDLKDKTFFPSLDKIKLKTITNF